MDVTLFQFTISTNRVDYIVTNDKIQKTSQTVQDAYSMRWVIEKVLSHLLKSIRIFDILKEMIDVNNAESRAKINEVFQES